MNVLRLFLRRIFLSAFTACGVVVLVSGLLAAIPGDPVDAILGERATSADRDALRSSLGLDQPAGERLLHYARGLLHGDLGRSIVSGRPVTELLGERYPATADLALAATALALGDVNAGVERGEVLRVSTSDGRLVWRTRLPGGAPSEAVVSSSYLLVSQSRGALHFLDSANGRPVTQFRPGYGIDAPATVGQDGTAYLLTNGGVLYGFRPGG